MLVEIKFAFKKHNVELLNGIKVSKDDECSINSVKTLIVSDN